MKRVLSLCIRDGRTRGNEFCASTTISAVLTTIATGMQSGTAQVERMTLSRRCNWTVSPVITITARRIEAYRVTRYASRSICH